MYIPLAKEVLSCSVACINEVLYNADMECIFFFSALYGMYGSTVSFLNGGYVYMYGMHTCTHGNGGELHVQQAYMDTAAVWGVFGMHTCTYKTNGISFWKGWVCMYSMHICTCTWTPSGDIWRERGTLDIIPPPSVWNTGDYKESWLTSSKVPRDILWRPTLEHFTSLFMTWEIYMYVQLPIGDIHESPRATPLKLHFIVPFSIACSELGIQEVGLETQSDVGEEVGIVTWEEMWYTGGSGKALTHSHTTYTCSARVPVSTDSTHYVVYHWPQTKLDQMQPPSCLHRIQRRCKMEESTHKTTTNQLLPTVRTRAHTHTHYTCLLLEQRSSRKLTMLTMCTCERQQNIKNVHKLGIGQQ